MTAGLFFNCDKFLPRYLGTDIDYLDELKYNKR